MNRTLDDWQRTDAAHHLHPFTDFGQLAEAGTRVIELAAGAYVFELGGRQLLDAMSGLWCCNLGYTQPEIVRAVTAQLEALPYYNSFFQCTSPPAIELAARLSALAPGRMPAVFFTNSGSEANDTALRLVQRYWALAGQPQRRLVVSRRRAYHGSTIAAASLGGMDFMHAQFERLSQVLHITPPHWFDEGGERTPAEFGLAAARELEEAVERLGAGRIAAFIGEPVQGAGGVLIPPDTYWPEIARICRAHGILLIVDEVITGFGRTGHWFASQHYGLAPDLMPFAKAVTNGFQALGGVMVGERVAAVLRAGEGEFAHGFTYSGHPAACAAALATLDIHAREGIAERVRLDLGPYFGSRFATLGEHPLVGEARTLGMLGALELVPDKHSRVRFEKIGTVGTLCRNQCLGQGLVMRATGDTMIVAPPLILTHTQIDELVEKAWRALDATLAALAR
jgi:putrescine---pyruvate transaminase